MLTRVARVLLLAVLLTNLLFLSACASANSPARAENRLIYGLTLQPAGFDPHLHASSELSIPMRQVYDTLVYRDPQTQDFVHGLASSWTISPDGRVYTFTLKQGVTFHDGTPFNAQAVATNLDRITNPENASQRAVFMLGSYAGYEIVDDYTIRLLLAEAYSPLLDSLSQVYLGIASPTALSQYTNERYQFYQVGTGPYRMVEYVPTDRLVLERNPDYAWGPSFYAPPEENGVDAIEFRFFTDAATRALALEGGEVQVMGELPPVDARALAASNTVRIIPVTVPGQPLQFMMNTARFPTDTVAIRQAIVLATNREAIIDTVFQRFSPVAWAPLSATTRFYNASLAGAYGYDLSRARSLIESVGFADADNNGYYDFGGAELRVTVIAPTWGMVPEVVQLLQDHWRDAGIRAVIQPVPTRSSLIEMVNGGEYNLVAYYEFGADPSILNNYFTSNGAYNWTGYTDAELDRLLRDAVIQTDPNTRAALYAQAQQIIMEQALILPIRDYVNLNGVRSTIDRVAFDAYGWAPLLTNFVDSGE